MEARRNGSEAVSTRRGGGGEEDRVTVDVGVMNRNGEVWMRPDGLHDGEVGVHN